MKSKALPTKKEWRAITKAAGTDAPSNVLWVINNWSAMVDKLQACVQKHDLGVPGQNVADAVVAKVDELLKPLSGVPSDHTINHVSERVIVSAVLKQLACDSELSRAVRRVVE